MLAPSTRARDLLAGRRAAPRRRRGGADRGRALDPDLAPDEHGRPGRRAGEPPARARHRPLRRRARLRAGPAEPLVPRADLRPCPDRCDVLLVRATRLSGAPLAPRPPADSRRRAARDLRGDRRSRGRALRGRLPARTHRRRHGALPARRRSGDVIALELEPSGRPVTRALARLLRDLPDWELLFLHTKPLGFRPAIPLSVRRRVHVRSVRRAEQRAALLAEAAIFVPAPAGEERLALEAAASGVAAADGEDAAAIVESVTRLAGDAGVRERAAAKARAAAERQSFDRVADGARCGLLPPRAQAPRPTRRRQRRRPARRPRLDRRRPAHAHGLVARLLDRR